MKKKTKKKAEPNIKGIEPYIKVLARVRDQRDKLNAELKKINEQNDNLEQMIINQLRAEGLEKVTTKEATAGVEEKTVPVIENFDKALKWILRTRSYEFLQKNIRTDPWRERLAEGNGLVPGTKKFTFDKIKFRRKPKKGGKKKSTF